MVSDMQRAPRTDRPRAVRRRAAFAIATAGVVNVVSATTPPIHDRLLALRSLMPMGVPKAANALVVLAGIGLLMIGRGLRRGQRRAWWIAFALLATSTLLHLLKGVDVEEASLAAAAVGYLVARRRAFTAPADPTSMPRALAVVGFGGAIAVTTATLFLVFGPDHLALAEALPAVAARLIGLTSVRVPAEVEGFLFPALTATGAVIAATAAWVAFRPLLSRHDKSALPPDRAFEIVRQWGGGTLDYFALRADKQYFIWGNTLVAFRVFGVVCLVSPDPIGPPDERAAAWSAFHQNADRNGWSVAILGADEEWLPIYKASEMRTMYVGDEGVVDVLSFSLEGGRMKGLRHVVNRMTRHGYSVRFFDPANLDASMRSRLSELMTQSRRGEAERGFSMTLGRLFDSSDRGLLLAVAFDTDDKPVAFCQYVPAAGIDGFSLDMMRRDRGDHPNGLVDFVILETIRHLRDQGRRGLALNFATLRAVIAGEAGDTASLRVQRWFLQRMSDSMQIESLWRFNAKYFPTWRPRYAVYDSVEDIVPAAMAVARAESFWELPVLGRFLEPQRA